MLFAATKSLSDASLVAPYRLIGFAALSVERSNHLFDLIEQRCLDDVLGTMDIGFDAFHRIVFSGRHLFECRSMHHIIHTPRIAMVSRLASRTSPIK